MVQHARSIINLAIDNTDDRTSHLTDHIFHIITFSAITLCRLLQTYRGKLGGHDEELSLQRLVLRLIDWLRSIGFPCHVSRVLCNVISAYYSRFRSQSAGLRRATGSEYMNSSSSAASVTTTTINGTDEHPISLPRYSLDATADLASPDPANNNPPPANALSAFDSAFSWAACFDFDAGAVEWPQYEDSTDGGSVSFMVNA